MVTLATHEACCGRGTGTGEDGVATWLRLRNEIEHDPEIFHRNSMRGLRRLLYGSKRRADAKLGISKTNLDGVDCEIYYLAPEPASVQAITA